MNVRPAVVFSFATLALLACGAFGGDDTPADDMTPQLDASPAIADGSTKADATVTGPDAEAGTPPADCANPKTITVVSRGDVGLTQCDGSNARGSSTFIHLNPGIGPGLVQFLVLPLELTALKAAIAARPDALLGAELTLHADPSCSECGGLLEAEPGTLEVHNARNDWEEGLSTPPRGAPDKCRRVPALTQLLERGWGASDVESSTSTEIKAPVDFDAHGGATEIVAGQPLATVGISAADLTSRDLLKTGLVSLYVEMKAGRFLFATHEHKSIAAPTLTIRYCAP